MPDTTPVPREKLAKAFHLYTKQGLTFREVGAELGVSESSAERWVKKGAAQEAYVELLDDAEKRVAIDSWLSLAIPHAERWLDACNNPRDYAATVGAMVQLSKALRDMYGLDRPTRVEVSGANGTRVAPDVALIAAIRELKQRNAEDLEDLRGGGPGVIEGGQDA